MTILNSFLKNLFAKKANQLLKEDDRFENLTFEELNIEPVVLRFSKKTAFFAPFLFKFNDVEYEIRIHEAWLDTDVKTPFKYLEDDEITEENISLYVFHQAIDISEFQLLHNMLNENGISLNESSLRSLIDD